MEIQLFFFLDEPMELSDIDTNALPFQECASHVTTRYSNHLQTVLLPAAMCLRLALADQLKGSSSSVLPQLDTLVSYLIRRKAFDICEIEPILLWKLATSEVCSRVIIGGCGLIRLYIAGRVCECGV